MIGLQTMCSRSVVYSTSTHFQTEICILFSDFSYKQDNVPLAHTQKIQSHSVSRDRASTNVHLTLQQVLPLRLHGRPFFCLCIICFLILTPSFDPRIISLILRCIAGRCATPTVTTIVCGLTVIKVGFPSLLTCSTCATAKLSIGQPQRDTTVQRHELPPLVRRWLLPLGWPGDGEVSYCARGWRAFDLY